MLQVFKIRIVKWLLFVFFVFAITYCILFYYSTAVTKNIDAYIYSLPFLQGTSHKVVQGYGGLFSHKNIAAIDFEMPEGTPIYAAREGTIYAFTDKYNEGGISSKYKKKANYIIIKHSDGSFGCYWHLQQNGVLVKKGSVIKGQQIGFSGATGQVLNPHLHFSVKRKLNYDKESFVQTKFKTTEGIVFLKNETVYTAID